MLHEQISFRTAYMYYELCWTVLIIYAAETNLKQIKTDHNFDDYWGFWILKETINVYMFFISCVYVYTRVIKNMSWGSSLREVSGNKIDVVDAFAKFISITKVWKLFCSLEIINC